MALVLAASSGCKNDAAPSLRKDSQPSRKDSQLAVQKNQSAFPMEDLINQNPWIIAFRSKPNHHADSFQFPIGNGKGNPPKGYYNAQGFGENAHLGDDWNGTGGGNSDLGDPVYAIGNGFVRRADQLGPGWGNVVRVVHLQLEPDSHYVESIYAHLDTMLVKEGDWLVKGEKLGTIGNANGAYWAHLHLEIRDEAGLPIGPGYSTETEGYLDPTRFILEH